MMTQVTTLRHLGAAMLLAAGLSATIASPTWAATVVARNAVTRSPAKATEELRRLDALLRSDAPRPHDLPAVTALSVRRIQQQLRSDEGLLVLALVGADVHLLAISRTDVASVRHEGQAPDVAASVAVLRCQMDAQDCPNACASTSTYGSHSGGSSPFDSARAYELYRQLVQPVEDVFASVRTLYVAAAGSLRPLPLTMLLTQPPREGAEAPDAGDFARAEWLGDRYAMVTLASASDLQRPRTRPRNPERVAMAGFGDPAFGIPEGAAGPRTQGWLHTLAPLPDTRAELTAIASILGAPPSSLRLGAAATETAVKTSFDVAQAGLVIFATHAMNSGEVRQVQEPSLVLTPPATETPDDDGLLTASEIGRLSLSADLVILSASRTAIDGSGGAERLSDLTKAFLRAGARSLLASHWRVADDSTSVLTVQTLAIQKANPSLSKAQALQAAMKAVRTGSLPDGSPLPGWKPQWAHPAAWAPFTLVSAGE